MQVPTRTLQEYPSSESSWDQSDDDNEEEYDDKTINNSSQQSPPEHFTAQVQHAISQLGGAVMPKLTWSCPKDAIWISTFQTMKCTHSDEVMMLLKCSDRIAHDLSIDEKKTKEEAEEGQHQHHQRHVLALRQWKDINPVGEFRCFVSNDKLIGTLYTVHYLLIYFLLSLSYTHIQCIYTGICQREVTEHFPSLIEDASNIEHTILSFHAQHIAGKFPLKQYVYDCYVETGTGNNNRRVMLVDFNPWGATTSPLLYHWEELEEECTEEEEDDSSSSSKSSSSSGGGGANGSRILRIIDSHVGIRPNKLIYGVPYDFVMEGSQASAVVEELAERVKRADALDDDGGVLRK
jgi:hypothetical protein